MTHDSGLIWMENSAVLQDRVGLHARPAVKLTKLAKTFESRVEISADESKTWVNAKSPNAVMKLRAPWKTRLVIRAAGLDAKNAVKGLITLVEANFGERVDL